MADYKTVNVELLGIKQPFPQELMFLLLQPDLRLPYTLDAPVMTTPSIRTLLFEAATMEGADCTDEFPPEKAAKVVLRALALQQQDRRRTENIELENTRLNVVQAQAAVALGDAYPAKASGSVAAQAPSPPRFPVGTFEASITDAEQTLCYRTGEPEQAWRGYVTITFTDTRNLVPQVPPFPQNEWKVRFVFQPQRDFRWMDGTTARRWEELCRVAGVPADAGYRGLALEKILRVAEQATFQIVVEADEDLSLVPLVTVLGLGGRG